MRTRKVSVLWACVLLAVSMTAHADNAQDVLSRYRSALEHEDAATLATLIRADAPVRIVVAAPDQDALVLTLTRDQYLQQLRALWRFSQSQSYHQSDIRWQHHGDVTQVSLRQQERYRLFGETLHQDAVVQMDIGDGALITAIRVQTLDW